MKRLSIIFAVLFAGITVFARTGIDTTGTNVVLSGTLDTGTNTVIIGGESRTNWPTGGGAGTITGGTVTAGATDTFVVTGPNAAITWNTNAAGGTGSGLPDINYEGDTTTITGRVYQQISDGTWQSAVHTNEDLCNKYIGISLGTNSTSDGMVVLGAITVTNEDLSVGSNVYVGATAGFWTQTVPTNDGYIVRAIGYATDTNEIYVTPNPIWLEVGDQIDTNDLKVTKLTVTGGATNGAVWVCTNANGSGTVKRKVTKKYSRLGSTTNTTPLVISGIGFRPSGVTVYSTGGANWGYGFWTIDSSGASSAIYYNVDGSSTWGGNLRLYTATDKYQEFQFVEFTDDGASFTRSTSGSPADMYSYLIMLFYP